TQQQRQSQKQVSSSLVRPNMATAAPAQHEHSIFRSQRTVGQQAARLTPPAEPEAELPAKALHRFGHDFSRVPVRSPSPRAGQVKSAISNSGGAPRQQADFVSGQGSQTRHVESNDPKETSVLSLVRKVLASPGRPLDAPTRAFFEPRFGHDFGHVRV